MFQFIKGFGLGLGEKWSASLHWDCQIEGTSSLRGWGVFSVKAAVDTPRLRFYAILIHI